MKAVILCAGYGTRLGELTYEVPKPMLLLAGKPLLEYTVRYLVHQGYRDLAINVHFKPEQIKNYFEDGHNYNCSISYFEEQILLGTAGALCNMKSWLFEASSFLVLYGDILLDQDLSIMRKRHENTNAWATLMLHQREKSNSIVLMDHSGRIQKFIERPSEKELRKNRNAWVNSGVAIISNEVLDTIPLEKPADLPKDVYVPNLAQKKIMGFTNQGYRCAIDSTDRLYEAERAIQSGKYRSPKEVL